ncbi:MAG TPA: pyridoxamine 5'-phosphate oxidase family protein, partial [Candidatus Thermoplasmatota archaeon]|nr:pyridoxamine 5'-phosphate oxidase family protein [Candidatus Thermoplasmatota archaeon]
MEPPTTTPSPPPARGATMRTMTEDEIDQVVSTAGFGILSLADGNRAYGVPLFYGARGSDVYFQTRAGRKSHYLYATTEACLSVSSARDQGEWATVQIFGRLERVDSQAPHSAAQAVLARVPPPLPWAEDDAR